MLLSGVVGSSESLTESFDLDGSEKQRISSTLPKVLVDLILSSHRFTLLFGNKICKILFARLNHDVKAILGIGEHLHELGMVLIISYSF